jgi:hypothetical protein
MQEHPARKPLSSLQVGWYNSTHTDAAAGTQAQILTQPALPGPSTLRLCGVYVFPEDTRPAMCGV